MNNGCPTCKQPFQTTHNFALEKMTQYITYPCKHHKLGCNFSSKATEIEAHEGSCEYGPFDCPLNTETNCQWSGAATELHTHIESTHRDYILKSERLEVAYNPQGLHATTCLIIFYKKIFKFCYNYSQQFCQWTMQIIGSSAESKLFKFDIDIFDNSGGKKRFLITGPVVPLKVPFNSKNCIKLSHETISGYVNNKLSYTVKISKE